MNRTIQQWIMMSDGLEYSGDSEILHMHQELHEDFGIAPTEGILDCERKLCDKMRSRGFEHRHNDALAKAAGTIIENPTAPTLFEVASYLRRPIRLQDGAVSIIKGIESADVYLRVQGAGLQGLELSIYKMVQRWLPPGINLQPIEAAKADGSFAEVQNTHDLLLDWNCCGGHNITTWDTIGINIRIVAAKSAPGIFSEKSDPRIPFRVVKAEGGTLGSIFPADSVYVFGPTLIPGRVDATRANPDGTPTGAIGDVMDQKGIRGAFEFWTASKRAFEVQHEFAMGPQGRRLDESEVMMLENYTSPVDMTIPDRDGKPELFPQGTWFQGARILNPQIAKDALERRLNSWSIYANCMGKLEDAQVS